MKDEGKTWKRDDVTPIEEEYRVGLLRRVDLESMPYVCVYCVAYISVYVRDTYVCLPKVLKKHGSCLH